jgi:microcystin-dependent protein
MPVPTRPTAPPQPLRSSPDTFSLRAEAAISYQWGTLPQWIEDVAAFAEQQANASASAAAAAGAAEGLDLTNKGGFFIRARFDETGTEFVPPSDAGTIPPGGIIMWSGTIANIPEGWALCNGAGGTPDLRDRFIVGAGGAYNPGATGGANSVALTEAQMPAHSHYFNQNTNATGNHRHRILNQDQQSSFGSWIGSFLAKSNPFGGSENYNLNGTNTEPSVGLTSLDGNHAHNVQGPTDSKGSGTAHENRPPYYALAYIMKL